MDRVKRFEAMTSREQARHLVYDHGFNEEYFTAGAGLRYDTREQVVEAFLHGPVIDDAEDSYPIGSSGSRHGWHSGDHTEQEFGGAKPHTHHAYAYAAQLNTEDEHGALYAGRLAYRSTATDALYDALLVAGCRTVFDAADRVWCGSFISNDERINNGNVPLVSFGVFRYFTDENGAPADEDDIVVGGTYKLT